MLDNDGSGKVQFMEYCLVRAMGSRLDRQTIIDHWDQACQEANLTITVNKTYSSSGEERVA